METIKELEQAQSKSRYYMDHKIVSNKAQCLKCGDIIESKSTHDFVTCKCGKLSVDGGHEYLRRVFDQGMSDKDWKELSELKQ